MQLGPKERDLLLLLFFYCPQKEASRGFRIPRRSFSSLSLFLSCVFLCALFARIIFIEVTDKKRKVRISLARERKKRDKVIERVRESDSLRRMAE